jgi:hypothetical protein
MNVGNLFRSDPMSIRNWRSRVNLAFALVAMLACASIGAAAPLEKAKPQPKEAVDQEPVERVEENLILAARNRAITTNNLKQIGLAVWNYCDENTHLPANVVDKNGKPLLSWRVELLPYIEQQALYDMFKRDEPWDSANNLPLLERMPKVFSSPRVATKKKGFTVYQGFAGPDTIFEAGKVVAVNDILDGTTETIMAVEASTAVPWTKPVDLQFDPKKDVVDFGKAYDGRPLILMCDGSWRTLKTKKVSQTALKGAITRSGGEVLGDDWSSATR